MRVEKSDQVFPWEKYFTLFKIAKQDFIEPPKNISPSSKSQNSLSSKLQNKIHSSSENLTCTVSSPLDSTAHWASHLTTKFLLQCQLWVSTSVLDIYFRYGYLPYRGVLSICTAGRYSDLLCIGRSSLAGPSPWRWWGWGAPLCPCHTVALPQPQLVPQGRCL